jgi:DNA-binding FrmR family transcriptional regulator
MEEKVDKQSLPAARQAMLKRLARVEGQIRGLQAMIVRGEECESIAQQFSAARKALDKAYQELLACLLEEAVVDPELDSAQTLARVRKIFTKYT